MRAKEYAFLEFCLLVTKCITSTRSVFFPLKIYFSFFSLGEGGWVNNESVVVKRVLDVPLLSDWTIGELDLLLCNEETLLCTCIT